MNIKDIERHFKNVVEEHIQVSQDLLPLQNLMAQTSELFYECLSSGHKIMFAGNGGSASDAQHLAAEFVGRFQNERCALSAIALTTDTSALTAIGNDYGFDDIFARQVEALAHSGDIFVALSTSGQSENLVCAVNKARLKGCYVVGFLGKGGGQLQSMCDKALVVPSAVTARIQEMHILMGHFLCERMDTHFS